MPFHAATKVAMPTNQPIAAKALKPRGALLKVSSVAAAKPNRIVLTPRPRAKMTRGRLPLQMVQRMKFGWDWCRSEHSTVAATSRSADGCVVVANAFSTAARSRDERLSSRGAPSIRYVAITRLISSRKGWIVTETTV